MVIRFQPERMSAMGFTLVELLVVLVILATLTGFVLIRVSGTAQSPRKQLEQFADRTGHYCNRAVLQGRDLGIRVTEKGYDYWEPDLIADSTGNSPLDEPSDGWIMIRNEQVFQPILWQVDTHLILQLEGRRAEVSEVEQPQIICFASSQVTPFVLEADNARQRALLVSDSYRNQSVTVR